MNSAGSLGLVRRVDANVIALVHKVKEQAEAKQGKQYKQFAAVSYREQIVNGINYFVKVRVDHDEFIHLRIYQDFRKTVLLLNSVQEGHTLDSEITYF
ncbi:hypothetical protein DFA_04846 [Cavenderia fasciculata]|uniref:Cystatin domain-containing protein n=1 Tax=Cavenderia fasciculata TaxID=261658 RepID=F4PM13_CACFS|nr:uncharacterized protein DFA_04846 [Cavenderia fasciculata]EGG22716.1 hypothetical protein DFA_04846 [Cavenderia fasciculata]|eukprot:XP_004360567.1 hypothetical protein DFA_04846 [Cavenderia fasciculata]